MFDFGDKIKVSCHKSVYSKTKLGTTFKCLNYSGHLKNQNQMVSTYNKKKIPTLFCYL